MVRNWRRPYNFPDCIQWCILNTIAGVQDISKDFYNAARSMGANTLSIIKDIVLPGSLPGVMTGVRLAIGLGWMSVI